MASFWLLSAILIALIACNCSLALASRINMKISTISAAPTTLPTISPRLLPDVEPLVPPTLSPDVEPLFPTPGGSAYSPSESSLPIIPSSPSPPNPDMSTHSGTVLAFPPSESMPAVAPSSKGSSLPLYSISHLAIVVICLMQLHGM